MSIMVSIVCNTFNHEKYVRDALESFVTQKTNFEYEVLVYDDASTDKTADIIREYEEKYPTLIKPVYQTVNQYSQGLLPDKQNRDRAIGKYVAYCEGDDYWIDDHKLQKQVDYMETHPDCTFCFTNGVVCYGDTFGDAIVPWDKSAVVKKESPDYNVGELDLLGYIPTASFLFPNQLKEPELPEGAFAGDIYHKFVLTNYGYAHFIDEKCVVYRRAVSGSLTAIQSRDLAQRVKQVETSRKLYVFLKEYTNHQYDEILDMAICIRDIVIYYETGNYDELRRIKKSGALKLLKRGNTYTRMKYSIMCKYPKAFRKIKKFGKSCFSMFNR